jgi:alkanesulfonate monooxygenase SsuD/methylene tetrahydromethanopterin reductase-like flavin-dependent oxidoreductase (luciferase family)
MRFGLSLPPFGDFADVRFLAELTRDAESAGWDAFFLWDHMVFDDNFFPIADPWIALAAGASVTSTIRLGTLITPLARRRPWVVARQSVSLDQLSKGRFTLGVGLGDREWDLGYFGEEMDRKARAQMLDESLDILMGLWAGKPFHYDGQHYHLREVTFQPTPVQTPRIPIWAGGFWPALAPAKRAARLDGYNPLTHTGAETMSPDTWRDIMATIRRYRTLDTPFDLVKQSAETPEDRWHNAGSFIAPFEDAGVNWWIEDISPWRFSGVWASPWLPEYSARMIEMIRRGPPKM